jgi:hypothetical protein
MWHLENPKMWWMNGWKEWCEGMVLQVAINLAWFNTKLFL